MNKPQDILRDKFKEKIEKIIKENIIEEYSKSYGDGLFTSVYAIVIITSEIVELFDMHDVIKSVCYKDCGNTHPSGSIDKICLIVAVV